MDRTITAVFDTEAEARRAEDALAAQGFARGQMHLYRQEAGAKPEQGFWEGLASLFVPEDDRHGYAEAARRGGTVLSLSVPSERFEAAADILEANGAVDLDEREAAWRAEGWSGRSFDTYGEDSVMARGSNPPGTMLSRGTDDALGTNISGARPENDMSNPPGTMLSRGADEVLGTNMSGAHPENEVGRTGSMASGANPPGTMLSRGTDEVLGTNISGAHPEHEGMATRAAGLSGESEAIPVVEERLRVGKRETAHGRVRIRSYVVETPVEEQVTLRRETVDVERRVVDRPVTDADALFQDRVIEATESEEEAVIAKEARVTGEVVVRKDSDVRTETVRDTVRRTEVEVERDDGTTRKA
ncbi:YsnF/AvaK domain-containing protein [Roseococcus sp. DSY-14]|uniref:YsnF/AvaK domain-containing protein n=1 Tax=Roseococcus sp. DSY-14 TaxID=3369650 RepID=UPI00387AF915